MEGFASMRSNSRERQAVQGYFEWQSHDDLVLHLEKAASERVGSIPYEIWDLHAESKPGPTDSAGGPLLVLQRQSACRERLKRVGR